MALHLKPKRRRKLPDYTTRVCPFNGHQATWCRHFCEPSDGRGVCGREATHGPNGMRGRTQAAIAKHRMSRISSG